MVFWRAYLSVWVLFFSFSAAAFVNVESLRQIEGEGFIGKTGLQASGQQGNTNKFTSQFSTMNVFRQDESEWLFSAQYKYGESAFLKDTNQGSAHLRHTWNYTQKYAYEAFLQSGFDEFKELNSRNYIGGNLRTRILNQKENRLFLGTGAFYEIEDFTNDNDSEGFRGNIYVSLTSQFNEIVAVNSIIYYQPKIARPENYRLRWSAGLDVRLTQILSLDLDFNVVHDTGLPADVQQTDVDYLIGFSVSY